MQNIPAEHLSLAAQLDQEILSGGLQPAECIVMKPVSFNNSASDQSHLNEQGKKSVKKAIKKRSFSFKKGGKKGKKFSRSNSCSGTSRSHS